MESERYVLAFLFSVQRTENCLPVKKRLIIHLIIGLLTFISSTIAPNETHATNLSTSPEANQGPYSVLHSDQLPVKTVKAAPKVAKAGTVAAKSVTTTVDKSRTYKGPKEVESVVRSYFKDTPLMADIAKCESHFRQFSSNGEVYRGKINTSDVGVMQINEKYHLKTAEKLGIDIYSLEGNVAYAKYLYKREGSYPWISSSGCWGQTAVKTPSVSTTIN